MAIPLILSFFILLNIVMMLSLGTAAVSFTTVFVALVAFGLGMGALTGLRKLLDGESPEA